MRNRFRPNVTPRGSRSATNSTSKNVQDTSTSVSKHDVPNPSSSTSHNLDAEKSKLDTNASKNTTNNEEVGPLKGKGSVAPIEERTAHVSESDTKLQQKMQHTLSSDSTDRESNLSKSSPHFRRRSRIRPTVVPVARSRSSTNLPQANQSYNVPEKSTKISAVINEETDLIQQTQDTPASASSSPRSSSSCDRQKMFTASQAESSDIEQTVTSSEQHTQPVATLCETDNHLEPSTKRSATAPTPSLLTRRKRALPNLGSANRRRRSVSTSRDGPSTDKSAQQVSSDENLQKENTQESTDVSDKTVQRGGKRARVTVSESEDTAEPALSAEQLQQLTSEDQQSVQDGEEASVKKRKKKGNSKQQKVKDPDVSTMTMQDLIYYNPKTNPMVSSVESKKNKSEKDKNATDSSSNSTRDDRDTEASEHDGTELSTPAPPEDSAPPNNINDDAGVNGEPGSESSGPAPRVKLAADGSIILDEESLLIRSPPNTTLQDSEIVYEDAADGTYNSYSRHRKVERWSMEETLKFYKALSQVGTDFSLMLLLFPSRKRKELKAKFKREEKLHRDYIEKALKHRTPIDVELYAPHVEGEEIDDALDMQQ